MSAAGRQKKIRGVIVWDFDRVLFDTAQQSRENRNLLSRIGITKPMVLKALAHLEKQNRHFSISAFIQALGLQKKNLPARKIRHIFRSNLATNQYYAPEIDRLVQDLKKRGFVQIVLSLGNAKFQRQKMSVGCGALFHGHFARIYTTMRPKFLMLKKVRKQYFGNPLIFIDDTREHLELAKKHILEIKTIYYSNVSGHSIKGLKKKILQYAKI